MRSDSPEPSIPGRYSMWLSGIFFLLSISIPDPLFSIQQPAAHPAAGGTGWNPRAPNPQHGRRSGFVSVLTPDLPVTHPWKSGPKINLFLHLASVSEKTRQRRRRRGSFREHPSHTRQIRASSASMAFGTHRPSRNIPGGSDGRICHDRRGSHLHGFKPAKAGRCRRSR